MFYIINTKREDGRNMKQVYMITIATVLALIFTAPTVLAEHTATTINKDNSEKSNVEKNREISQSQLKSDEARERAAERKQEIKNEIDDKKSRLKVEVCERKKLKLSQDIPKIKQGALSVKKSIDNMYEKVLAFYETSRLTVSNYSELVGQTETAKIDSEAALMTLESYDFNIDCNEPELVNQLAAFKLAVGDARQSLFDYRQALVDLISAMRASSSTEKSVEDNSRVTY